ncbi:aldose 1-/glucose-6-phosphate 1-epimerase [Lucifera butyrica]|uniref:Aldose 1-/glucose-6-phosphate 1-epimerase n=1 Tax=Lucifera butyrica TaxID=1351585 RepID=A0A498RDG5_9FIRM|nr:aldose 1-epimerase family protein [Lucifera butyrica]VBB09359.1 aldose 1-/glucose-6-phosphate 1-epimerase [Lucifera butyrica]
MTSYRLKNEYITVAVNRFGAELKSLVSNETGREYLWQADPAYWRRTSPVLFPVVGRLKQNSYQYRGKTYPMMQHGFARDKEFTLLEQTDKTLHFMLENDAATMTIYPFDFRLIIGYEIVGKKVVVSWRVVNTGDKTMYFSVGSHPAFICPFDKNERQSDCFLAFDTSGPLVYHHIGKEYLYQNQEYPITLKEGALSLEEHLFDLDALLFENYQFRQVSLLNSDKKPYLSVKFHAPVVGIWSPPKKKAPFVCIEPWFGRCDAENFEGTLAERAYGNMLAGGAEFGAEYTIEIM